MAFTSDNFGAASKPILNAAQFSALCSQVSDSARSLASCQQNEVDAESLHLRNAINDLCAAEMARKSDRLIRTRRSAVSYANEVLARRCA